MSSILVDLAQNGLPGCFKPFTGSSLTLAQVHLRNSKESSIHQK